MASVCARSCMFTYDSDRDYGVTRTALGIACSWVDLCIRFDRQGSLCPAKNSVHYRTISTVGPKLFAVCLDTLQVFYHLNDLWHPYQSARDVRLGTLEELQIFFNSNDNDEDDDEDFSQEDNAGQDRDDQNGQQTKDSTPNHHSDYLMINQSIVHYYLIRLFLFFQVRFCHRRHQSLTH